MWQTTQLSCCISLFAFAWSYLSFTEAWSAAVSYSCYEAECCQIQKKKKPNCREPGKVFSYLHLLQPPRTCSYCREKENETEIWWYKKRHSVNLKRIWKEKTHGVGTGLKASVSVWLNSRRRRRPWDCNLPLWYEVFSQTAGCWGLEIIFDLFWEIRLQLDQPGITELPQKSMENGSGRVCSNRKRRGTDWKTEAARLNSERATR